MLPNKLANGLDPPKGLPPPKGFPIGIIGIPPPVDVLELEKLEKLLPLLLDMPINKIND